MDAHRRNALNLLCRLCLAAEDSLMSIFEESYTFLPQRIAACVNVEVFRDDKLPKMICRACLVKVETWFDFKKCCDESQVKLRQWASINNILTKSSTSNSVGPMKDEMYIVDDDLEIVDNDLIIKKEESLDTPMIEEYFHPSGEEPVAASPICELQISTHESTESLLVPTFECPASAHGMLVPSVENNAPAPDKDIKRKKPDLKISRKCRACFKIFSTYHNRIRHEKSIHQDCNLVFETDDSETNSWEKGILDTKSTNLENCSKYSDVTIEQFAASLQLVQNNTALIRPKSEKHFVEFNKTIQQMLDDLTCYLCGYKFSKARGLLNHISKLLPLEKYSCYLCCISFPNQPLIVRHKKKKSCQERMRLIQEENIKSYQHYQCAICEELYVDKTLLNRHLIGWHIMPGPVHPLFCDICKSPFSDMNQYKDHFQSSCFYKIYCSICKESFKLEQFEEHIMIHDDDGEEFSLEKYVIKENDCRIKHKSVLNEVKTEEMEMLNKYSCSICGDQFPSLDLWCEHQKNHSDSINRCLDCNRVFVTELELEEHKSTHNNNIKLKLYRCSSTNAYTTTPDLPNSNSNSPHLEEPKKNMENQPLDETKSKPPQPLMELEKRKRKPPKRDLDYRTYKTYSCSNCKKSFRRLGPCRAHKKICVQGNNQDSAPINIKKEFDESQENSYECNVCNKKFLTERGLLYHSNHHIRNHTCSICKKCFDSEKSLSEHAKTHSPENGANKPTIFCEFCPKVFFTTPGLSSHKRSRHPEEIKPKDTEEKEHKCTGCDKSFTTERGKSLHERKCAPKEDDSQISIKTETETLNCNFCNAMFDNRSALNSHIKVHLNGVNISYNCTFCPRVFANSYQLTVHVQAKHAGETKDIKIKQEFVSFRCKICKKNYSSNGSLQKHLKIHAKAPPNKKFKCGTCGQTLLSAGALARHEKANCLHCIACNKYFETAKGLSNHKSYHKKLNKGSELFNCSQCTSVFKNENSLQNHLKIHKKLFKCTFCSKTFNYMKTLTAHCAFAHNLNSKPENDVRKTDAKDESLEIRQENHTSASSTGLLYRCTECNTTFVNSKTLRMHVLSAHMTEEM